METSEGQIFARFLELIRKHSDEERNIEFYALLKGHEKILGKGHEGVWFDETLETG